MLTNTCDYLVLYFRWTGDCEKYLIVVPHFLDHSFVDRHLGCFHVLAVLNNAATNMECMYLSEIFISIFFGYILWSRIAESICNFVFKNLNKFGAPGWLCPLSIWFLISTHVMVWGSWDPQVRLYTQREVYLKFSLFPFLCPSPDLWVLFFPQYKIFKKKKSQYKFKKIQVLQSVFSDHNGLKLEMSNVWLQTS